ncbi:MAG: hypothetical protein K2N13_05260 [Paraprevotella sp.]|nr:hypothetical protein [Paraprevotella sp.]
MAELLKLTPYAAAVTARDGFEHGKHYSFYDAEKASEIPPAYYQDLLATAQTTIQIWDSYYMEGTDANVFSKVVNDNISIHILTASAPGQNEQTMKAFADNIKKTLEGNGVKGFNIVIQCYNEFIKRTKVCHDRFLILDHKEIYLIGASMNNQILSSRSFGICNVSEQTDKHLILSKYKDAMNRYNPQNSYKVTRKG